MTGPSTSPYTPPTEGSYNASPPPDDGSQTEANRINWSKIKTKLADIIRSFALAVDTAVTTMAAKTINTDDGVANEIGGNIGFEADELTIASGAIVPNRSHHTVDTESDAASDDLATITNTSMAASAVLILRAAHTDRTVVIKHGTGNIYLVGDADFSLDDTDKAIVLHRRGSDWFELTRTGSVQDVQSFTASGTWNKPSSGTVALVMLWGAGGSGGRGDSTSDGGGGGGGSCVVEHLRISKLGSTETVTIGAGGESKATAGNGTAGGNSTFGSHLTAYGGGAGGGNAVNGAGGGGAGQRAVGANASGGTAGAGGRGATATLSVAGFDGGAAGSTSAGSPSYFGGGGGGDAGVGGASVYGGGGGGGAGGAVFGGGASLYGGGGGGAGADHGAAGAGGASVVGGAGGAGGQDVVGTPGTQPGGGGGGANDAASGAGADGMCIVVTY